MTDNFDLFQKRLSNARRQVQDLLQFGGGFGLTTEELWGAAKFQFSEAKRIVSELKEGEKKEAEEKIAQFRQDFEGSLDKLE